MSRVDDHGDGRLAPAALDAEIVDLRAQVQRLRSENARLLRLLALSPSQARPPGSIQTGLFDAVRRAARSIVSRARASSGCASAAGSSGALPSAGRVFVSEGGSSISTRPLSRPAAHAPAGGAESLRTPRPGPAQGRDPRA